jgi:RimJ/RimL family protein N-acetyltransferase
MSIAVREMTKDDISLVTDYFLNATPEYLEALGVDINKIPAREEWIKIIMHEFTQPVERKKLYYVIWQKDNIPVGHSHINDIVFAREAFMHLHLWNSLNRNKGDGTLFVKESLNYYFKKFNLQKIFCQPYALNPAPNHTLKNVGFEFIKTYETIPGWLNFKQPVNLWQLDRGQYLKICAK